MLFEMAFGVYDCELLARNVNRTYFWWCYLHISSIRNCFFWKQRRCLSLKFSSLREASCRPSCYFDGTRRCRKLGGSFHSEYSSWLLQTAPCAASTQSCSRMDEWYCSRILNDWAYLFSPRTCPAWTDHQLVSTTYAVHMLSFRISY